MIGSPTPRAGWTGATCAVLVAASLFGAAPAQAGEDRTVKLTPKQETGDVISDGSGSFTYFIEGSQLCYTLSVADLTSDPVGAHIHPGAKRTNGGIAVGLITPPAPTSTVSECITATEGATGHALSTAELAALAEDPRAFYVNVHTVQYAPGEVRGQLK